MAICPLFYHLAQISGLPVLSRAGVAKTIRSEPPRGRPRDRRRHMGGPLGVPADPPAVSPHDTRSAHLSVAVRREQRLSRPCYRFCALCILTTTRRTGNQKPGRRNLPGQSQCSVVPVAPLRDRTAFTSDSPCPCQASASRIPSRNSATAKLQTADRRSRAGAGQASLARRDLSNMKPIVGSPA